MCSIADICIHFFGYTYIYIKRRRERKGEVGGRERLKLFIYHLSDRYLLNSYSVPNPVLALIELKVLWERVITNK